MPSCSPVYMCNLGRFSNRSEATLPWSMRCDGTDAGLALRLPQASCPSEDPPLRDMAAGTLVACHFPLSEQEPIEKSCRQPAGPAEQGVVTGAEAG
jgi:hypothetical protein